MLTPAAFGLFVGTAEHVAAQQVGDVAELQQLWARYLAHCGPLTVDPFAHIESLRDSIGPGELFALDNNTIGSRSLSWRSEEVAGNGNFGARTTWISLLAIEDGTFTECYIEEPLPSWNIGIDAGQSFSGLLASNPQISVEAGTADFRYRDGSEALTAFDLVGQPYEVLASGVFEDTSILTLAQFEDGGATISLILPVER